MSGEQQLFPLPTASENRQDSWQRMSPLFYNIYVVGELLQLLLQLRAAATPSQCPMADIFWVDMRDGEY